MKTKQTKKWVKPLLIILSRGRAEEAVLGNCKTTTIQGPYQPGTQTYCESASCKRATNS